MNFLANFQWYRKWRGGRWAIVGGMFWGTRWFRPLECVECYEEDWTK